MGTGRIDEWQCHMVSKDLTADELLTKLHSVEKKYGLMHINDFKPEWNKNNEAHAHFTVILK